MKPLLRAILFGTLIAALNVSVHLYGISLWNSNLLSTAGLIAGIFFILAMIFQSALQDYKTTDQHIADIRGTVLAINDINLTIARRTTKGVDVSIIGDQCENVLIAVKKFAESKMQYKQVQAAIEELTRKAEHLYSTWNSDEEVLFLAQVERIRGNISYISYSKSLQFPTIGYVFLYVFMILLLILEVFAVSGNILLSALYMFALSFTLLFFAELIRDLDKPFHHEFASFKVDTTVLQNGIKTLRDNIAAHKKPKKTVSKRKKVQ